MSKTVSQQPRLGTTQDSLSYIMTLWQQANDDIPAWGTPGRAAKLREFARTEPILSGALSSMVSKACSLDWQVIGGRNRVQRYQELLAEAEDGKGWQDVLSRWVQDYLNTDLGGFLELARATRNGPVAGIYHLDAECMGLTGNATAPVVYSPKIGGNKPTAKNDIRFAPQDFAHIVDMPSTDESKLGLGFCAVSRSVKAAKVLLALYNYDEEKLRDMPMPGLVTVTGLTMDEIAEAFKLYNAHRQSRDQAVFKGLLWLASQVSPLNPINANLVSFAGLPENFDREQTYSLYIYTLALVFGVDAREFWPATQSGATKGEAEVQAQKAKGKGFGQMLTAIERAINWKILPESIEFAFDRRNDDDDLAREIWRGQVIKNIRSLWEPAAGAALGLIDTEEARRMLVELQAVPDWVAPSEDATMHSQDRALGPQEPPHEMQAPEKEEPEESAEPEEAEVVRPPSAELAQKASRARLDRGEDLVAMTLSGKTRTLWSSRTQHFVPASFTLATKAQRDAALAHLQAAGLLITNPYQLETTRELLHKEGHMSTIEGGG